MSEMAIIRRKGSEFVVEVNDKIVHKGSDQKAVEMWAEKHYDSVRYMNSSPFETGRQRVQNQLAEKYPQFFQNKDPEDMTYRLVDNTGNPIFASDSLSEIKKEKENYDRRRSNFAPHKIEKK